MTDSAPATVEILFSSIGGLVEAGSSRRGLLKILRLHLSMLLTNRIEAVGNRLCSLFWTVTINALLLPLLTVPGNLVAQPPAFSEADWDIRQWTTEEGLPQNTVKALAQTPDGYLWIGTLEGLARFDGVSFTIYNRVNTPGMLSDAINVLTADIDGTLWIGTENGLIAWRHGVAKRWTAQNGLSSRAVYQLLISPNREIWWRGADEFGTLRDAQATSYGTGHGLSTNKVWRIIPPKKGGLVALTLDGVQWLDRERDGFGEVVPWPIAGTDWQGHEDAQGRLCANCNNGSFRLDAGRWVSLGTNDPPNNRETNFLVDHEGREWRGFSATSLTCTEDQVSCSFPIGRKPDQSAVSAMLEDREGNMWIGTAKDGLYRLRHHRLKTWNRADQLPSGEAWSVSAAPDGSVWASTKLGLVQIKNGQMRTFADIEPIGPSSKLVWAAQDGGVWISKHNYKTHRFDGKHFTQPVMPGEKGGLVIDSFYENRSGNIFIGLDCGVYLLDANRCQTAFPEVSFDKPVVAMLEDPEGNMWFGTRGGGVKRFGIGGVTAFATTNGLSDDRVTALHADNRGGIWIATENGLNRFKNGNLARFGLSEGLGETVINQILEDQFGNYWLSGLRGIYRVPRAELDAVADGSRRAVRCLAYAESDGMSRAETNGGQQPAGCKSSNGHLWFPTTKGIVEIDPELMEANDFPPPVVLEQVKADDKVIFGDSHSANFPAIDIGKFGSNADGNQKQFRSVAPVNLAPGTARLLEFRYTANSLTAPEKVRFKYKLEPIDQDWRNAGAQRAAIFTNLRPGNYTFRVAACNHRGSWNEAGAMFQFSLAPHFHETKLFYLLSGLATLMGGLVIHSWRVRFLRRIERLEQQSTVQAERSRIARDLHDELGSRLTALAMRAELTARHASSACLKEGRAIAQESRALAERMRDVIWAVDPKGDSIEAFVGCLAAHAEEFFCASDIRLRLEFPDNLPLLVLSAGARHQLTMFARESLHNVLKHSGASEVRLGLEISDSSLRVYVSDNGAGFQTNNPKGRGLANMRARIQALNGVVQIHSKRRQGTIIEAQVALKNVRQNSAAP